MASEQIETPVVVEIDIDVTTTGEAAVPAVEQVREKPKRQRKAPEELYDLSKPIPHVSMNEPANHIIT